MADAAASPATNFDQVRMVSELRDDADVVLEGVNIAKRFGAVVALDDVTVRIRRGQVTALIGDNGAGKSTLVNVLSGALRPDTGRILFQGADVGFNGPHEARRLGIETVWQNLALCGELDVASNIYIGRELVYFPWLGPLAPLKQRAMAEESEVRLRDLGADVGAVAGLPVRKLSGGQQQAVAVARAAGWASQVLFLDEPTASLGIRQSAKVLELANRIAERGSGVLIISHSIPMVLEMADVVVVLRHGQLVAQMPVSEAKPERLVALMLGLEAPDGVKPSRQVLEGHNHEQI